MPQFAAFEKSVKNKAENRGRFQLDNFDSTNILLKRI